MPAKPFLEPLLTLPEAAELTKVSQKTIRRWISIGRIRGYRLGDRLVRVSAADLAAIATPIPAAVPRHRRDVR